MPGNAFLFHTHPYTHRHIHTLTDTNTHTQTHTHTHRQKHTHTHSDTDIHTQTFTMNIPGNTVLHIRETLSPNFHLKPCIQRLHSFCICKTSVNRPNADWLCNKISKMAAFASRITENLLLKDAGSTYFCCFGNSLPSQVAAWKSFKLFPPIKVNQSSTKTK